jgi:hypothetical protein
MNNISMSRISPKLISVEGNRVGSEGGTYNTYDDEEVDTGRCKEGLGTYGGGKGLYKIKPLVHKGEYGRFPTQLFTNIKNDRYKYVKNIT